jgi:hypothetical protein
VQNNYGQVAALIPKVDDRLKRDDWAGYGLHVGLKNGKFPFPDSLSPRPC